MTKLYLIRHAEAEGNIYRRIHGQYDSLVTDKGYAQIDNLAKRFENEKIDAVYCSDLVRTRVTAEALGAAHGLRPTATKYLRELYFGEWEDKTWGEVLFSERSRLDLLNNYPLGWMVPGSERFVDMSRRVTTCIGKLAARHQYESVAIVGHGLAIRSALCFFTMTPIDGIDGVGFSDNTAVSLFEVKDNRFDLIYKNDNSHLNDDTSTFRKQKWWRSDPDADINLWFKPWDFKQEGKRYGEFRRDAWDYVYGESSGYDDDSFLSEATLLSREHPQAVVFVMYGEKTVGILQLDVRKGRDEGIGHIAFIYLIEEYRGRGLAVQLVGHAVGVYRNLGRKRLRLNVSPYNTVALNFYGKYGFSKVGEAPGARGNLIVMEKDITVPKYDF